MTKQLHLSGRIQAVGNPVSEAAALADEHDLLQTGGSDCHGPDSEKFRIGEVRVPRADLQALAEAAGVTDLG